MDSRGIPGWEKVAQLARSLLDLDGLSLSNGEAQKIKALWNALDPYDKKATEVMIKSQVQLRGHFCSQKNTGNTTREQMRRYIICKDSIIILLTSQVLSFWSFCAIIIIVIIIG